MRGSRSRPTVGTRVPVRDATEAPRGVRGPPGEIPGEAFRGGPA